MGKGYRIEWRSTEFLKAFEVASDIKLRARAEKIASAAHRHVKKKTRTMDMSIEVRKVTYAGGGYMIGAQMSGAYEKFYASFLELGTAETTAEPFLRPALYGPGVQGLRKDFNESII